MEARASEDSARPGARNLSAPLAAWLRSQGWTALEQAPAGQPMATVAAHWLSPAGARFELDYTWAPLAGAAPVATCRLRVLAPGTALFRELFTAQYVYRLREARTLLLNCVAYATARQPGTSIAS